MVGVRGRFFECRALGLGPGEHVALGVVGVGVCGFEDKGGRGYRAGVFPVFFALDPGAGIPHVVGDVSEGVGVLYDLALGVEFDGTGVGVEGGPCAVLDGGGDFCLRVGRQVFDVDDAVCVGLLDDAALGEVDVGVEAMAFVDAGEAVEARGGAVGVSGADAGAGDGGEVSEGVVSVGAAAAGAVNDLDKPAGGEVVLERHPVAGKRACGVFFFDLGYPVVVGDDEGACADVRGQKAPECMAGSGLVGEDEGVAFGVREACEAALEVVVLFGSVFFGEGEGAVGVLYEGARFAYGGDITSDAPGELPLPSAFLAKGDGAVRISVEALVVVVGPAVAELTVVLAPAVVAALDGDGIEAPEREVRAGEGLSAGEEADGLAGRGKAYAALVDLAGPCLRARQHACKGEDQYCLFSALTHEKPPD